MAKLGLSAFANMVKTYHENFHEKHFTIYNRVYLFGGVIDSDIMISWGDGENDYAIYDIRTVFEYIENGTWDTTTYEREQKIKKLLGGTT